VLIKRYKDEQGILKTAIKHSQIEMCLVFIVDYETCFFCQLPPSSSLLFVLCFLYKCINKPDMFHQIFFPFGFLVPTKPTACLFNNLHIPGDQIKKSRNVMASYLLTGANFYIC